MFESRFWLEQAGSRALHTFPLANFDNMVKIDNFIIKELLQGVESQGRKRKDFQFKAYCDSNPSYFGPEGSEKRKSLGKRYYQVHLCCLCACLLVCRTFLTLLRLFSENSIRLKIPSSTSTHWTDLALILVLEP